MKDPDDYSTMDRVDILYGNSCVPKTPYVQCHKDGCEGVDDCKDYGTHCLCVSLNSP